MSAFDLSKRGNGALSANYPGNTISFAGGHAAIAITTQGSDWYWAVCAVMVTATLTFLGLSFTKPREERVFHYITAAVTMVASIAYFSMASNIGWAPIAVEFVRSNPKVAGLNREIFYVRYIDWFITTPLLLLDLLLTAGLPWPTLLWVILVDEMMIVTGLVGALVHSSYKWGYWTFGCVGLAYIVWVLVWEGRRNANVLGKDVGMAFLMCGSLTSFLWILYPLAWALCEGGNVISSDGEAVFYGILDLLAKPVFGALLIFGHRNIDPSRLGLYIKPYGGSYYPPGEKIDFKDASPTNDDTVHDTTNGAANGGPSGSIVPSKAPSIAPSKAPSTGRRLQKRDPSAAPSARTNITTTAPIVEAPADEPTDDIV